MEKCAHQGPEGTVWIPWGQYGLKDKWNNTINIKLTGPDVNNKWNFCSATHLHSSCWCFSPPVSGPSHSLAGNGQTLQRQAGHLSPFPLFLGFSVENVSSKSITSDQPCELVWQIKCTRSDVAFIVCVWYDVTLTINKVHSTLKKKIT